ncbi:MAG: sugar phosphate isomerase/epimerase [Clostridiaceae bacterium]|nr:sugar phosphate isomerase/epimerase [Clostridiaceae bacterium]
MKTNLGLQLFSLRQKCDENLENVFSALSRAGYDGVEFYSFYNIEAGEMRQLLNKYNLKAMGTHTGIEALTTGLDDLIRYCTEIGGKYVTLAYYNSDTKDGWLKLCEILDKAGKELRSNGLTLLYHNHAHEFELCFDGEMPEDIILNNTSSVNLSLELDIYWAQYAGIDPEKYFKDNLSRIRTVHLKDMDKIEKKMTEVGTGRINCAGIYKLCKQSDFDWVILEQDEIYIDPFESVKISLDNVKRF